LWQALLLRSCYGTLSGGGWVALLYAEASKVCSYAGSVVVVAAAEAVGAAAAAAGGSLDGCDGCWVRCPGSLLQASRNVVMQQQQQQWTAAVRRQQLQLVVVWLLACLAVNVLVVMKSFGQSCGGAGAYLMHRVACHSCGGSDSNFAVLQWSVDTGS
jgi:hypothetical protein